MTRIRVALGCLLAMLVAFVALARKPWEIADGGAFFGPPGRSLADAAAVGLWWAALANAALLAALLAGSGAWAAPGPAAEPSPARARRSAAWLALLAAAALLALGLRWPLAQTGLWSDEAWTTRYTIAGTWHVPRGDRQALRPRPVPWRDTLWRYDQPTNQVLYSVIARVATEAWRAASGREPPAFDERVLRAPALLAAGAAVVLMGLLLAEWGLPRAGLAAAYLLALHPWYIRWGASARSYSLVVALALAAALVATRAVRSASWRPWLLYGALVFCLVWGHLFAVYLAATLGAGALAAIALGPGSAAARRLRGARCVVVNLAAGMLLLQLLAPNLTQLGRWRGIFIGDVQSAHLTLPALGHLWTLASLGIEAREPSIPEARPGSYPTLADWSEERPWVWGVALGVLPLLVAAGALALWARGGAVRWLSLGLASGLPLALVVNFLNQDQWYPRFAIYALPSTVGFAAVGLDALLARLPWRSARARHVGVSIGLAAGLVAFALFVAPKTAILLSRPQQPSRDVVALLHARAAREPGGAIQAVFSRVDGGITLRAYDAQLRAPVSRAEVAALCQEANASGRALLFAYGHAARNRRAHPELFRWLDDPSLFEELAVFHAVEQEHAMRVLRYTGRPLPAAGGG